MATKNYENGIIDTSDSGDIDISQDIMITGEVYWVNSVTGDNANAGTNRLEPKATLAGAISAATTANGDIIIIESGHTETSATEITIDKSNLKIYGLGTGTTKPTFTVNGNVDLINFSASMIEINNLRFAKGTAAHTARVNINGGVHAVRNCDFICGVNDLNSITIESPSGTTIYPTIEGCTFTIEEDGPDTGIVIQAAIATGVNIISNTFDGGDYNFDLGGVYTSTATKLYAKDNVLINKASIVTTGSTISVCTGTISGDGSKVVI
jgi:hypothetical protein